MITEITTIQQLKELETAVKTAVEKASMLSNTEDGGTCNMDSCILGVKIPKHLREQTSLNLYLCDWGRYRGWYFLQDIPCNGCGNRRTRQAEAASASLEEAGYRADVYYEID